MSETELKLLLPGADPKRIAATLARHPVLRRRARSEQQLHNVYYDTPEQDLRQRKVALRVRRLHSAGEVHWIMTLKTAGTSVGGLSQRGEWEATLPDAQPVLAALSHTPWAALDPEGRLWPRLVPAFVTTCTRTLWQVRQRDGCHIEVALDVGEIVAGDRRLPMCELELELKAGSPEALFVLARHLGTAVALMPGQASKAERGYALARTQADGSSPAQAPTLPKSAPLSEVVGAVLGAGWDATLRSVASLLQADTPAAVHQARVAWRRQRSVMRLLRPLFKQAGAVAPPTALRAFWQSTGPVRELDVMLSETLPVWAAAYVGQGDHRVAREAEWADMLRVVARARADAAAAMLNALAEPEIGLGWLTWGQALTALPADLTTVAGQARSADWPRWVTRRLTRLHRRQAHLAQQAQTDAQRHVVRLLAKRLRYGVEAFESVLPKRETSRWMRDAKQAQWAEGHRRDLAQCVVWLERLQVPTGPLAFMRGVCASVLSS